MSLFGAECVSRTRRESGTLVVTGATRVTRSWPSENTQSNVRATSRSLFSIDASHRTVRQVMGLRLDDANHSSMLSNQPNTTISRGPSASTRHQLAQLRRETIVSRPLKRLCALKLTHRLRAEYRLTSQSFSSYLCLLAIKPPRHSASKPPIFSQSCEMSGGYLRFALQPSICRPNAKSIGFARDVLCFQRWTVSLRSVSSTLCDVEYTASELKQGCRSA